MNIGLYFGSFNPIHTGHLIIANFIANLADIDQVWFVVSPQNPLKKSSTLLNEYNRLHLAKLAVEENPLLKVSEVEFKLPRPSYTIDTITYLKEKYSQHNFSIIMGSDSYNNIGKWKNSEKLKKENNIVVYVRPNFPLPDIIEKNITRLEAPLLEISSTLIRGMIKKNLSIRYLVPDAVFNEIEQNNYYKDL